MKKKLNFPQVRVRVRLTVTKDDKTINAWEGPAKSWTRNYYNWAIYALLSVAAVATNFGAGYISLKRTSAVVSALNVGQYGTTLLGAAGIYNRGIVVGTSDAAESFEDYNLGATILHGTGAGQLSFLAQAAPAQSYNAGTKTWSITHKRIMNNNSGNIIGIKETGIIADYNNGTGFWLICRDVLAATFDVADGGQLNVEYPTDIILPG